jgi:hypothetical protein
MSSEGPYVVLFTLEVQKIAALCLSCSRTLLSSRNRS